jgi:hypothetical protein
MFENSKSERTFLIAACLMLSSCVRHVNVEPSIEFIQVPKADAGGTDSLAVIEGRVSGAQPGQQIVLFARSGVGVWWVQPFADRVFTAIQADSKWTNSTHLGTEYAAMLVNAGYRPPPTLTALPGKGGAIAAVATARGEGNPRVVSRTLHFSGYEWEIRQVPSNRGGALNTYDPANAWTDVNGRMHLNIAAAYGQWTCSEVILTRSLGYGSYSFVVQETSRLEPAAVLGMFLWDDLAGDANHREIDVEISRWGDKDNNNAQYVIQPFFVPANVVRFMAPAGVVTHSFRWEPGRVSFKSVMGSGMTAASRIVREHTFTSGVPSAGAEAVRINLYPYSNKKNPLRSASEVVIEKFEYLP